MTIVTIDIPKKMLEDLKALEEYIEKDAEWIINAALKEYMVRLLVHMIRNTDGGKEIESIIADAPEGFLDSDLDFK